MDIDIDLFDGSFNGFDAFNGADFSREFTEVHHLPSQGGTPPAQVPSGGSGGGAGSTVGKIASTTATGAGIGASIGGPLGAGIGAGIGGLLGIFGSIF